MLELCEWHIAKKTNARAWPQTPASIFLVDHADVSRIILEYLGKKRGGGILGGLARVLRMNGSGNGYGYITGARSNFTRSVTSRKVRGR